MFEQGIPLWTRVTPKRIFILLVLWRLDFVVCVCVCMAAWTRSCDCLSEIAMSSTDISRTLYVSMYTSITNLLLSFFHSIPISRGNILERKAAFLFLFFYFLLFLLFSGSK